MRVHYLHSSHVLRRDTSRGLHSTATTSTLRATASTFRATASTLRAARTDTETFYTRMHRPITVHLPDEFMRLTHTYGSKAWSHISNTHAHQTRMRPKSSTSRASRLTIHIIYQNIYILYIRICIVSYAQYASSITHNTIRIEHNSQHIFW